MRLAEWFVRAVLSTAVLCDRSSVCSRSWMRLEVCWVEESSGSKSGSVVV